MIGRLVQQSLLTDAQRDAMYTLLCEHFENVRRPQFDRDLGEKNWVVLIERDQALLGFSTLLTYETEIGGDAFSVIYSGDTIVSPDAWGSATFPRTWIHAVYELRKHYPRGRLIWLLLTSGFRTYRFLPVFWREFFPVHDRATPPSWQVIIDELATRHFGGQFDATRGVVRFTHPQRLRGPLCDVPVGRTINPHVAFFLERNPGHVNGDELVCMTELDPSNLTPAGRRVVFGTHR